MGHNLSEWKRRRQAMETDLRDCASWRLHVDCGAVGCARNRVYAAADLAGAHPGLTVGQCLRRFPCSVCRGHASTAAMICQRGAELETIPLRGKGAAG